MAQTPTVNISSALAPAFVNTCFGTASSNMVLSVSGTALINGITVAAPAGFQVSLSPTTGFANTVTVAGSGTIAATTVYARLTASIAAGTYAGNLQISSTGAGTKTVAIQSSKVNALPLAEFTNLSGYATCFGVDVPLSISGTPNASVTYQINNTIIANPVLLDADGKGAIQTSNLPVGQTVFSLVSVTNPATGCSSNLSSANGHEVTVAVDPVPVLSLVSGAATDAQVVCRNAGIADIVYTISGSATGASVVFVPAQPSLQAIVVGNTLTISGVPTATTAYTISTTGSSCAPAVMHGTIALQTAAIWTGAAISGDWTIGGNWCSGAAPRTGEDVLIAATTNNYPVLPGSLVIGNLTIAPGNHLVIGDGNTLTVNGTITGSSTGTISASASASLVTSGNGTVFFTAGAETLRHLTVKSGTLTLGNALNIAAGANYGVVTVEGSAHLQTGDHLTLKSDAGGTAAVAANLASPDYLVGKVTVERFIPLSGVSATRTGRAWRLLTAPVANTSINEAWQEGALSLTSTPSNPHPTYGTLISGLQQPNNSAAFSHGYDFWGLTNSSSSIRYYVPGSPSGSWNTFESIKDKSISDKPAYMLFVRGDRSVTTGAGATTLRATGNLKQGAQPPISIAPYSLSNAFVLLGNPYPAPVSLFRLYDANRNIIQNEFHVWDAHLGTYGSYVVLTGDDAGNYSITPACMECGSTGITPYIQSGEGFFAVPANGGNLSITEGMKTVGVGTGADVSPFRVRPATVKQMRINLNLANNDGSATLADGLLAQFDNYFTDEPGNIVKALNFNENIGLVSGTSMLIVGARPDIVSTDTLQLKLWNLVKRDYQLQLKADRFDSLSTLHAWLEDAYLGTKQQISLKGDVITVSFSVNSDSLSWKSDRFRIVFQNQSAVLPVTLTGIKAAPQNGGVSIDWTVTNEQNMKSYTVERSIDGGRSYAAIAEQSAKNATGAAFTTYNSFDALPQRGDNVYRVKTVGKEGAVTYTASVTVSFGTESSQMLVTVYPNPVTDGKVNVQLGNLPAGNYSLRLYGAGGQRMVNQKLVIGQSNGVQSCQLRPVGVLAAGSYTLHVADAKGKTVTTVAVIVAR